VYPSWQEAELTTKEMVQSNNIMQVKRAKFSYKHTYLQMKVQGGVYSRRGSWYRHHTHENIAQLITERTIQYYQYHHFTNPHQMPICKLSETNHILGSFGALVSLTHAIQHFPK